MILDEKSNDISHHESPMFLDTQNIAIFTLKIANVCSLTLFDCMAHQTECLKASGIYWHFLFPEFVTDK